MPASRALSSLIWQEQPHLCRVFSALSSPWVHLLSAVLFSAFFLARTCCSRALFHHWSYWYWSGHYIAQRVSSRTHSRKSEQREFSYRFSATSSFPWSVNHLFLFAFSDEILFLYRTRAWSDLALMFFEAVATLVFGINIGSVVPSSPGLAFFVIRLALPLFLVMIASGFSWLLGQVSLFWCMQTLRHH